jgi:hypothetical protein
MTVTADAASPLTSALSQLHRRRRAVGPAGTPYAAQERAREERENTAVRARVSQGTGT